MQREFEGKPQGLSPVRFSGFWKLRDDAFVEQLDEIRTRNIQQVGCSLPSAARTPPAR
jgi:hypothetical protein